MYIDQEDIDKHLSAKPFKLISEAADELGVEAYVIGGYVRDIFLRRPSKDIDVVAVGSGIELAKAVAHKLGRKAHISIFKNFGTAQVKAGDLEVEFVGARKESYTHDSRKPVVEDGTLEDDQNRRDFTINALALCLNGKRFGELIDPFDGLTDMGITMSEVFEALNENNVNTGGAYIEKKHMANFIRGEGLVKSLDDIKNIVVKKENEIPILIRDVAEDVRYGEQVRYGAFTQDGHEAVGGMILMLKGANSNKVVKAVKERMVSVQKSLPANITIEPFLDRSNLIGRTTSTIARNLIEGALIVIFVLVILLGSIRGGIITASVIPLALLFAFILMRIFGVWANLMSLGAIDFGIIVDGAVIIVEGITNKIESRMKKQAQFSQEIMDNISYDSASTMYALLLMAQSKGSLPECISAER